ncbi:glycoside hydrolase family 26 protein [Methylovirgula sp. 4M-Z18]|uniref:glycoside hydrolase family 26 protein n=1 Tax=Methylovirgula sp. 4M-Z18 TaxID=2293567 RepID=UPI000E2ED2FB|nr:glycosyl hydrolase [Methylovirgula sp. 4M-Z18]RFB79846.1 beta-mannosidase [Methylovirgula sp. 4M-Z18]
MSKIRKATAASLAAIMLSGLVLANSTQSIAGPQAAPLMPSDKWPVLSSSSLPVGAYDPHGDFNAARESKIEHVFLPWEDVDLSTLTAADDYARSRGRSLMISVEPWSWSKDWRVSPQNLYEGIVNGSYDANAAAICGAMSNLKSPVTIRWAQEMDENENQFTWSHWSGPQYIRAYRHFVGECRKYITDAKFMWSPKGNDDLQNYYPGNDVVDVIGLSVFGYQSFDHHKVGRDRNFNELLTPGYNLVKGYGKPIVVAELGYEGDAAYNHVWAEEVGQPHPQFPGLTAIVYFDDREVHPWPDGFGLPNWRVVQQNAN